MNDAPSGARADQSGPAAALPAGSPDRPPEAIRLRSAMWLVGMGYLLLTLCDYREGVASLALRYLLKDELQLTATQLAGFFLITKLAWYCKPFAGLLADKVRFLGYRRKGYLIVFSIVAGGLWLALAFFHHTYLSMLWLVLAINFALMMVHTTLGGLLVEVSQALGATGRISAVRSGTESFGWLLAGLVGGWIAVHLLHQGFLINAFLMIVLAAIFAKMLPENKDAPAGPAAAPWTFGQVKELFQHRTLWTAAGFWVLVKFSPGFGTPLFFHKSETLGLTPQVIGYLSFVSAAAGMVGSLYYMRICRRLALSRLLWLGIGLHTVSSLAFFGYRSIGSAIAIEALYGLCTALAFMPIFDLLARATPKHIAAFGYALIFSLGSLSVSGSDVLGSWIYERLGRSFTSMILLDTATTALVLLAIPFLPRQLIAHRDGDAAAGKA